MSRADLTAESLARIRQELRIEVASGKELREVSRVAECD